MKFKNSLQHIPLHFGASINFLFVCSNKCKIIVIGDTDVGKTSLVERFNTKPYSGSQKPTIGVDFIVRDVIIDDRNIRMTIWDTAGQERFRAVNSAFYRGLHGIMVVYDVTNDISFQNVESWLHEVDKFASEKVFLTVHPAM